MNHSCTSCGEKFQITREDLAFYDKVSPVFDGKKFRVPPPTLCPDCRLQRRVAWRNERKLYHRKCDLTGKQIISVYSQDKPYTVYEPSIWWSDAYDPLAYGQEFDFSKPFIEQFAALNLRVPKSAIQNAKSENCDYTNYSAENKNCYLLVGGLGSEDCLYGYRVFYSKDTVDCYDIYKCERCYECSESSQLYGCTRCHDCHNCTDCTLCDNCTGCKDCFGCANLVNQRFRIYNVAFSEQDYRAKVAELRSKNSPAVADDIKKLHLSVPHRYARILNSEASSGDQLLECKQCTDCYTLKHSQDCQFCVIGENDRDCADSNFFDNCELQYNCTNLEKNYQVLCGMLVWYCRESMYAMNSFHSHHLFGCSGMKKHEYCVLNTQYTKEEYEALVPKIIKHMQASGEWGQFFPIEYSPFCYNETVAHEYFPSDKKPVIDRGWKWHDEEELSDQYLGPDADIPESIEQVSDEITKQILRCAVTGRPYKIIPQELKFYRTMGLPVPKKCPDQRHKERMALRNPRKLWDRTCAKCQKKIRTTYAPERPEIAYCESCYLSTVY